MITHTSAGMFPAALSVDMIREDSVLRMIFAVTPYLWSRVRYRKFEQSCKQ